MATTVEFTLIMDKVSSGTVKSLESVLRQFRAICHSDEEFSRRASVERHQNPNIDQYYFDCEPVFYTKLEITNNTVLYSFNQGRYQP